MGNRAKLVASASAVALAMPLIMQSEGLRLRDYLDPVNVPTACFGHTGPDVRVGQWRTRSECQALLEQDLIRADAAVSDCITAPLTDHQRAALLSFTYNVGRRQLCTSTLASRFNAGRYAAGCAELSRWVYAHGLPWPGLKTRRARERAMCEGTSSR